MAEVPFRPVRQLYEYKGKGASASRELLEVPHIAKSTSAKALRLTISDENLEADYDFALLFLQPIDVVLL